MSPAVSTALVRTAPAVERAAHRDPNVLRWLAAYTASMTGDSVYYLALSWAAVQAGTPSQAGLVMTASAVPRALLMLGGGVIADRLGPRRVVIGSDVVRCAAVLAVAALLFLTSPGLWPLALLAVVFGTVDAVFVPAVGALPARVTSHDQLARVQGMRGLAIRFASVVGAPLGGLGVAVGGAATAFGLAGLLTAVSVPLLAGVRIRNLPPDDTADTGTATIREGSAAGSGGDGVAGVRAATARVDSVAGRGVDGVAGVRAAATRADPVAGPGAGGAVGVRAAAARADSVAGRGAGGMAGARAATTRAGSVAGSGADGAVGVRAATARAGSVAGRGADGIAGVIAATTEADPVAGPGVDGVAGVRAATTRVDSVAGPGAGGAVGGRAAAVRADLVAGLGYIRRHPVLAPLLLTIALGDLGFVGPLNVGLTLLADERGWGAPGMGWVLAGFGTGAGAASLLLTLRGRLPHAGRVVGWSILMGSLAIAALAYAPTVTAAVGAALLIGLLTGLSGAMCGALLQTRADPAYLGRVTSVSSLVSLGLTPLSMPLSAAAIGAWGTGPVFVASAVVCGLGGVVALCVPALRHAELPR
ncbi:MFS transporter [Streptomyces sp. YKOK-I1]